MIAKRLEWVRRSIWPAWRGTHGRITRWLDRRGIVVGGVLVTALGLVALSRAFSVSCPPQVPCVTLSELHDGALLPEAARVYDRHGELLAEMAGPPRRALTVEEIPELVAKAFVAVEDRRFWDHGGVDARGVVRAAVRNLRERDIAEGASTIPMQLVRTLWAESLRGVGPWRRKVIEARTAPRLIEDLGHERVLTLYLNAIYLGNGLYGVERASHHYFGVGVDELSVDQIATLVGITRSPEYYEPHSHPERARAVRNVVLATLVDNGVIDTATAELAVAEELKLAPHDASEMQLRRRTHLTAAVRRELTRIAPDLAGRQGLAIHTTIDARIQAEGERALEARLSEIEVERVGDGEPGDSVPRLEGAAVAMDPASGAVRAWIGGRDFATSEFDRVEQSRRQVGSLIKPFLMVSALERGYGVLDLISADTVPIPTAEGSWLPADHVTETTLPLREALVRSSNRAAAHLSANLGLETVSLVGARVGLRGPIPAVPSSAIGAFDASLLEMTVAYGTFGNRGRRVEGHLLERVIGQDGSELWARDDTASPPRVMDEATAFVVLDALRAVVDRGTGYPARATGYYGPAAGKTGTTNDGRDAWFIGLTPEIVAGVWIGFDQPREISEGRGGGALAAPVWGSWMRRLREVPRPARGAWIPPQGVERVRYDPVTGEVLGVDCVGRLGVDHQEAWVLTGLYVRRPCRTGVRGWLDRLWEAIVPGEPEAPRPVAPTQRRRPRGG
jgi:membrane peptidoglycan carboxypeptidase